jgi:ATP-dependent RNA helicase DHX8/PRP22
MADDDIFQLEFLSLVAKITQEIDNYTGMHDKTLAEFVIALHDDSKTLPEFKKQLKDAGADFPDSFVENVDRLILTMHPKHKKKQALPNGGSGGKENVLNDGGIDEHDKQRRLFPGLALADQPQQMAGKDAIMKEVDDMMSQFETASKKRKPSARDDTSPKRQRREQSYSPPRRRSPSPPRGRSYGRGGDDRRNGGRIALDDRPVMYKIYTGRVSGLKEFGAFVTLEGVSGRTEGMVHVSNIQAGARANSATDLLSRGQVVKVKVMSVAGNRVGLSMKDVDQVTGRDLTPHLRIKSEAEMEEERREALRNSMSGSNAIPLRANGDEPKRSAKRLTSPERWEIKQLIASGSVDASEYPELDEDFNNPTARAEVEEELDVEVREEEPPFLAGQTKRTLDLSPVKIVKAPDGSLNRAALSGAALAKERREMRQQEANEQADSEARDFSTPWLDPMSQQSDKVFAQDLRGNIRGQSEAPKWREATFNKATTFGEITTLSIQEQRKNLPIYKLRDPLLQAIREVCHCSFYISNIIIYTPNNSIRFSLS